VQALEQCMPSERINLNFADGMLFSRIDKLIEGKSAACALLSQKPTNRRVLYYL
jgi:hypothetical protein